MSRIMMTVNDCQQFSYPVIGGYQTLLPPLPPSPPLQLLDTEKTGIKKCGIVRSVKRQCKPLPVECVASVCEHANSFALQHCLAHWCSRSTMMWNRALLLIMSDEHYIYESLAALIVPLKITLHCPTVSSKCQSTICLKEDKSTHHKVEVLDCSKSVTQNTSKLYFSERMAAFYCGGKENNVFLPSIFHTF